MNDSEQKLKRQRNLDRKIRDKRRNLDSSRKIKLFNKGRKNKQLEVELTDV